MTPFGHRSILSGILGAVALAVTGLLLAAPVTFASTYRVTDPTNAGSGTLRGAIERANSHPGEDVITFDVDAVNLLSQLPPINDAVRIEGPVGGTVEVRRVIASGWPRFPILAFYGTELTHSSVANLSVSQGGVAPGGATHKAAGIYNETNLSLQRVTVRDNAGTGIVNYGRLNLDLSTVRGNVLRVTGSTAVVNGGGIDNLGAAVIDRSSIQANSAQAVSSGSPGLAGALGGGIVNYSPKGCCATLSLRRSTVSGNSAVAVGDDTVDVSGGGVANVAPASMQLDRVTISGNRTQMSGGTNGISSGGGVWLSDLVESGPVTPSSISGSTVVANEVRTDTEGALGANVDIPWAVHRPALTFRDTIVALPVPKYEANCVGAPAMASDGYNLEDGDSCGFHQATDIVNKAPKLGPLAGNGGPTQTHALLLGSPAIDKGHSFGTTTDQRGQPRPFDFASIENAVKGDGSDIGAFEVQPPPDTIITDAVRRTSKRHVTISFMSTAPGSTFLCRLDGKPLGQCASPFETPRLDIGWHTFKVRAIDPSGAVDKSPASCSFKVVPK